MRSRRRTWTVPTTVMLRVAAVALLLGLSQRAYAAGPPYTYEKIQFPGSTYTDISSINNAGVMVGTYRDGSQNTHGFKYDGSVYTAIDFPGATHTYTLGINDAGQIVGSHSLTGLDGPWHSYLLDAGVYTQFDPPGQESDARAINNAGDLVGVYNLGGTTPTHGFLRTGASTYTTIDYPGAQYTLLWGMNNARKMSGSYIDANNRYHGFWYANGTFTAIEMPGATWTQAFGINNLDQVVGWHLEGAVLRGFVYAAGNFRSFDVDLPGTTSTAPLAINDAGVVVGGYHSTGCPAGCGFIARPVAATPPCNQVFTLGYAGTTLSLNFTLSAQVPTTWNVWLVVQNTPVKLLSAALPAVAPLSFTIPLAGVPKIGTVLGLTTLSTSGGTICADVAAVNTGS